jgi:PAS domain S-box-containing protein
LLIAIAEQAANAMTGVRLRDETRAWRERLDAVFESMGEVVLVFDGEGRLALLNASAQELLGDSSVQIGNSYADVIRNAGLTDGAGRPLTLQGQVARRAIRGERFDNLEVILPARVGPARHLLISAVPLGASTEAQGAVIVARDITYFKELERMRAEFLSMVSHELRSPLTSILGFTQLLRRQLARGQTPRDLASRLATIEEQAKRVNALVEGLLDVSRTEANRLTLNLQPVDLAALIKRTVQNAAALASNCHLRVELPSEAPIVHADPDRIEQVLRNLLGNAIKFCPPHTEITVRLAVEEGRAVVSVADQGPGIAREDSASLFLPFHRVRTVGGREVKGIGLGLFISRSIVEAHRGRIWVQSQLGHGSTFHFSLPLAGMEPET